LNNDPMNVILWGDSPATQHPHYKFLLRKTGKSNHNEFRSSVDRTIQIEHFLLKQFGPDIFIELRDFMSNEGMDKEARRAQKIYSNLQSGRGFRSFSPIVIKNYTGAFVGLYPHGSIHPRYDRFLTIREGMDMMGMPADFNLIEPLKQSNHMCQNVPVTTAEDMAKQIKKYLSGELEYYEGEDEIFIQNNAKGNKYKEKSKEYATV
jgi:site-specific DNA-cytosine methylase